MLAALCPLPKQQQQQQQQDLDTISGPGLTAQHVAFLRAAIYAEQYDFAARWLKKFGWPLPDALTFASTPRQRKQPQRNFQQYHQHQQTSAEPSTRSFSSLSPPPPSLVVASGGVALVLRYYYLSGVVQVGCKNWCLAIRNFWTTLSVPTEDDVVSTFHVAAYKKMILAQCLLSAQQSPCFSENEMTMVRSSSSTSSSSTITLPASCSSSEPLSTPKAAPPGLARLLKSATTMDTMKSQRQGQQQRHEEPEDHQDGVTHMVEGEFAEQGQQPLLQQHVPEFSHQQHSTTPHHGLGTTQSPTRADHASGVRVYMDLVRTFLKGDQTCFSKLAESNAELIGSDGNTEIVHQTLSAIMKRKVFELSRIYKVCTLGHLATELELSDLKQLQTLLVQLSEEHGWGIEITAGNDTTGNDALVRLPKLTPLHCMTSSRQKMDDLLDISELMQLTEMVQKLDVAVSISPKYQSYLRKENSGSNSASENKGPRGVEDHPFE